MDATGQRPIKLPRYVVLSFYIVFSWWRCGLQRCWLRSTVRVACPEGHTTRSIGHTPKPCGERRLGLLSCWWCGRGGLCCLGSGVGAAV